MTCLGIEGQGSLRKPHLFIKTVLGASFLSLTLLGAASVLPMSAVMAQEDIRQFSVKTGESVNTAFAHAEQGEFEAAITLLNSMLKSSDLIAYERSTIYQMLGQYSHELNRQDDSQRAFENAINAGGLLPNEVDNIKLVIAQLMIANGQYAEGAQRLENIINSGGKRKPSYVKLIRDAWIQDGSYRRALPWAEEVFRSVNPQERQHFDIMNFLYHNLEQTDKQLDLIKQMVSHWPEDENLWKSWAAILANAGREQDAFEVQKMLYLGGGALDERELLKIVQYYSFYETPYQAAQILEKEMNQNRISRTPERLIQLSDLFRQAREYDRAIPIIEEVAKRTDKAKPFADWGEALYNQGDCEGAEKAFTEATNRGYDAGKSWMLIANCRYDQSAKLDRLDCAMTADEVKAAPISVARTRATDAFKKVLATSSEYGNAKKWLEFIESERAAFDRRCDFEVITTRVRCMADIKQAYGMIHIISEFELDDVCRAYMDEYNAQFRRGMTQR